MKSVTFYPFQSLQKLAVDLGIGDLYEVPDFTDEPKVYYYLGRNRAYGRRGLGSAVSMEESLARTRALGEMVERYALLVQKRTVISASFEDLSKWKRAIDPQCYQQFSEEQLSRNEYSRFVIKPEARFRWVQGFDICTDERIFIPQQLVEMTKPPRSEPLIRPITSNGAAGGFTPEGALLHALFESLERDAIVLHFLAKMAFQEIDISSCPPSVIGFYDVLRSYRIELRLFNASYDMPVPVIVAALIDKAKHRSCSFCVGSKAGAKTESVALGAILEALSIRFSTKIGVLDGERPRSIRTFRDHAMYWANIKEPESKLRWLLNGMRISFRNIKEVPGANTSKQLAYIKRLLIARKLAGTYVPIQTYDMSKRGYFVMRVLVPGLQELYADERFPLLGGKPLWRINLKGLNMSKYYEADPHPFA